MTDAKKTPTPTMTPEQVREVLRSATLGREKKLARANITYQGNEFEFRQPTVKERADLRSHCTTISPDGVVFDMFEFLVRAVIAFVMVPGTDITVYTEADYDELCSRPTGDFVDVFSEEINFLLNIDAGEVKDSLKKT